MLTHLATLCAGLALGVAPAAKQPAGLELHPVEAKVIKQTNAERARYGLPALKTDPSLMKSARRHAAWMTNSRNLQHTNQQVGENIAMGQSCCSEVVGDWMNSPGHRANILNRSYTRIGAAAYHAPDGTTYWCQQFLW